MRAYRLVGTIADAVERLADACTGKVLAAQNIIGGVVAGVGRRGHRRRGKARAFLIGPVDDAERRLGLDPGIVQRPHYFERGQRA